MKARLYTDMRGILYILQSFKFFRLYLGDWLVRYPQDFYRRALKNSFTTTSKKNKLYLR